ncbi:uncharacterized protein [Temnothorax nylanderi]|uniref:uncharacterized protein isoform X3 n=1 Tax=Temnothorax nylanderi TaxID=102681 RepID=UPI003A838F2D
MGSSGQLYSLSWGEFSSSLASAVQVLRGDGDLVDVTLAAGGRSFRAHKIVLCAASPFLLDLLKSTPCQHPVVMLAGIGADDLESLLEFVYRGEVSVEPAQLPSLLQAAHCLCIHGLTKPTVLTESGEEVPASAIPTATNDGVSRATGNSYYPLKRRKKRRRKSSTSSAKWQCTSNTTDSESRPLDDNNRTMPYENKDDDTMETDDTAQPSIGLNCISDWSSSDSLGRERESERAKGREKERKRERERERERVRERGNKFKPSQSNVSSAPYGNIVFVSVNSGQLPGRKLREQPSGRQSFTASRLVRRGQSSGGASGTGFGRRIASAYANADAAVAHTAVPQLPQRGLSVRSGVVIRLSEHPDGVEL